MGDNCPTKEEIRELVDDEWTFGERDRELASSREDLRLSLLNDVFDVVDRKVNLDGFEFATKDDDVNGRCRVVAEEITDEVW